MAFWWKISWIQTHHGERLRDGMDSVAGTTTNPDSRSLFLAWDRFNVVHDRWFQLPRQRPRIKQIRQLIPRTENRCATLWALIKQQLRKIEAPKSSSLQGSPSFGSRTLRSNLVESMPNQSKGRPHKVLRAFQSGLLHYQSV